MTKLNKLRFEGEGNIGHMSCFPPSLTIFQWVDGSLTKPHPTVPVPFGPLLEVLSMRHVSLSNTPQISRLCNLRVLAIRVQTNYKSAVRLAACFRNMVSLEDIDLTDSRLTANFGDLIPRDSLSILGNRPCLRVIRLRAYVHQRALAFLTTLKAPNIMLVDLHQCQGLRSLDALTAWPSIRSLRFSRRSYCGCKVSIDLVPPLPRLQQLNLFGHRHEGETMAARILPHWPQLREYCAAGVFEPRLPATTTTDAAQVAHTLATETAKLSPTLSRILLDVSGSASTWWCSMERPMHDAAWSARARSKTHVAI